MGAIYSTYLGYKVNNKFDVPEYTKTKRPFGNSVNVGSPSKAFWGTLALSTFAALPSIFACAGLFSKGSSSSASQGAAPAVTTTQGVQGGIDTLTNVMNSAVSSEAGTEALAGAIKTQEALYTQNQAQIQKMGTREQQVLDNAGIKLQGVKDALSSAETLMGDITGKIDAKSGELAALQAHYEDAADPALKAQIKVSIDMYQEQINELKTNENKVKSDLEKAKENEKTAQDNYDRVKQILDNVTNNKTALAELNSLLGKKITEAKAMLSLTQTKPEATAK